MKIDRVLQIAAVLLVGAFLYWHFGRSSRQPLIECDYVSAKPLPAPDGSAIQRLSVRGAMKKTSQGGMFDFDGSIVGPGHDSSEPLVGSVWLANDGAIEGLFLYVQGKFSPSHGRELTIATLNVDGKLDVDRSKAFLFFDPSEKLAHPANYACTIKQPSGLFALI